MTGPELNAQEARLRIAEFLEGKSKANPTSDQSAYELTKPLVDQSLEIIERLMGNKTRCSIPVKIKRVDAGHINILPDTATPGSAGLDLRAFLPGQELYLRPGDTTTVRTNIAIHIENPNYAGFILPRSGTGKKGLVLANTIGLIDSDYQGEILLNVWNRSAYDDLIIKHGDRIAQLVFLPVASARWIVVDEFEESTERGTSGFGSTGT